MGKEINVESRRLAGKGIHEATINMIALKKRVNLIFTDAGNNEAQKVRAGYDPWGP